jgi:hypothetical protein
VSHIVSLATIEREARAAAREGLALIEACPYPFGTEQADHFIAVYLLALERPTTTKPPAIPEEK